MIYKLEIANFYSVREPQVIDLTVGRKVPEEAGRLVKIHDGSEDRAPRVIAIYGANASGKSNVLRAIAFLSWFVQFRLGDEMGIKPDAPLLSPGHYRGMHGYDAALPEMRSTFLIAGHGVPAGKDLGSIDMRVSWRESILLSSPPRAAHAPNRRYPRYSSHPCAFTPICTSTPSTRARRAAISISSICRSGRAARASRSSAPAISRIPRGAPS